MLLKARREEVRMAGAAAPAVPSAEPLLLPARAASWRRALVRAIPEQLRGVRVLLRSVQRSTDLEQEGFLLLHTKRDSGSCES